MAATKSPSTVGSNNVKEEKQLPKNTDNEKQKKKGIGLLAFLFPILFSMLIIFGIWGYFIKTNKFNLGERLRPQLKDIPIVRMVLPPPPDPEDLDSLSWDELVAKYKSKRTEVEKLQKQIETLNKVISDLQKYKNKQEELDQQRAVLEQEKKALMAEKKRLQEDKLKFAEQVKNKDPQGFIGFFERMDKEIAQQIYEKVIREKQVNEEVKKFVNTFENMEPANAAKVLEQMGVGNIDLVANIMKLMKKQNAAEILNNMDPVFAANLADRMAVDYPIYPEE